MFFYIKAEYLEAFLTSSDLIFGIVKIKLNDLLKLT